MFRHTVIPAVHLFLIKDKQILLSRRFQTGYEDGNYSVPAGHVEKGESALSAMIREAKEEIGIRIAKKNLHCVHVMHRSKQGEVDERVDFFFECTQWTGNVRNQEPKKCDDLRWIAFPKLPHNTVPYVQFAITQYRQSIFFSAYGWQGVTSSVSLQ